MNRYLLTFSILAFSLLIFATSCDDDNDNEGCDTSNVTYTNSIATILNTNCALSGCHTSNTYVGSLEDYSAAVAFVGAGRITGAINHSMGFEPMPYPSGTAKLSDCDIDAIEAWIANGTPE